MKVPQDKNLASLGSLSQTYQVAPRTLKMFLEAVGAEPSLVLNGIPYFAISDAQDAELRTLAAELAATQRANDERNAGAEWTPEITN